MEDEGKVNLSVRMKKKALQGALEAAAKKKKARARPQALPLTVRRTCVPVPGALQGTTSTARTVSTGGAVQDLTLPAARSGKAL